MAETTKTFLELIKYYKIIIPLIQRDYAQGREKEKSKAEKFLEAIRNGCKSKLNLDFVYGERDEKNKIFIPLDGQQRLTTLFLIHWYLSLENDYKLELSNISYEVRSSSKDFLEELTKNENWKNFSRKNIKTQVENSNWFFMSWKNDLTVVSLLNMLDLIEKFFENENINNLNNITFEILYLDEFNLTNELYVKMNARGKPLTFFENFKAEFESYIERTGDSKEVIAKNKASFDNEWLNIFWNLAKKKVEEKQINIDEAPKLADEMFYNFFYNITFNFYLEKQDKLIKINNKEYSIINEFIKDNDIFNFYKETYNDINNTIGVIKFLNNIKVDDTFESYINSIEISQWERAKFHALYLAYIYDLDEKEFKRWERVSFNLINNQLIQSPDDLIKTIQSLNNLIEKSNKNIYEYIKEDYNVVNYFTQIQREEESLKAKLILENENLNWEEEIVKAEDDWYLEGQIGFLLEFSKNNLEKFIMYRDKFIKLWSSAKSEEKTITDNQILIYQALLVKGDYFINGYSEYKNRIFCSFAPALRTKFDNWRKLFNSENKKYLKDLLNDNRDLDVIIGEFNDTNDWRYGFIKYPEILKYCKQYQIRMKSEKNILLLSKERVYGEHAEYYTYWLKFELEKELKYNFSSSTEEYKYLEIDENQKVIFKDGKWYLLKDGLETQITKPICKNSEIIYEIVN